jgi:hypothetical protein
MFVSIIVIVMMLKFVLVLLFVAGLQVSSFRWLKPNKTRSSIIVKSYVDDNYEYYENEYHRKKVDENMKVLMDLSDEPIYTLIWYDCLECKQLLDIMKQENKKSIYINGSYYFYDTDENVRITPTRKKNETNFY